MRRAKTGWGWASWFGISVFVTAASCAVLGAVFVGARSVMGGGVMGGGVMGEVCTDAKALAPRNSAEPGFFAGPPRALNIAHRGASALAPEHSLAAYELALEQGADVLELDLRLTRDEALVVAHDRTLERTLGRKAAWSELSLEELASSAGGRAPPTLEQVLLRFPAVRFNLELKDASLAAARALAALLAERGAGHRVLVASWHTAVLEEFRKLTLGQVATSASGREALDYYVCQLMDCSCPTDYSALQLPALGLLGVTSSRFIARAHERGLSVHFWTVDDAERMRELLARGADGIMTNRPDRLARVLAGAP